MDNKPVPQSSRGSSSVQSSISTSEAISKSQLPRPHHRIRRMSEIGRGLPQTKLTIKSHRLYKACLSGHYQIVQTFLDIGDDVNSTNQTGETPLMAACEKEHIDIVKLLLSRGTRVNMQENSGWSALMVASQSGHTNIIKLLIEKEAEINMQMNYGWSALMLASQNGHSNVAQLLIEKGAEVNMQRRTGGSALTIASQNGHIDVVKLLIGKGAQVNMIKNDGWSALMLASGNGHSNVANLLIENGAEANYKQVKDGLSALILASQNGHSDVVNLLIEKGAEVNMQENNGWSALMIACYHGKTEVVQLLINNHADTSIQDNHGNTARDWARGQSDIVELLVAVENLEGGRTTPSESKEVHLTSKSPLTVETSSHSNIDQSEDNKTVASFLTKSSNGQDKSYQEEYMALSEQTIDLQDLSLKVLLQELKTVTDPIQLGIGLGIAQHQLEIIQKNNPQDISNQQIDLFSFIAKNYIVLGITWGKIADVLEEFVNMGDLALKIREKFSCNQPQGKTAGASIDTEDSSFEHISKDLVLFKKKSIGGGAFGTVFRGELNGQPCAIKVLRALADEIQTTLPTSEHAQQDSIERFRKECEYLESFKHSNVVCHLATRTHPRTNHLLLVLELMDCNLRQFFTPQASTNPFSLSLTAQRSLSHDTASALEYIHSRGVIHRDLCSDNILLDCKGENPIAKVCDFGMSRITKCEEHSVSLQAFAHKGYMPPEATDMELSRYNSKFDIYSFGALMVQIVRHLPTIKDRKERTYELALIDSTHPTKPLIEECLRENREDRPSASQLKRRLA